MFHDPDLPLQEFLQGLLQRAPVRQRGKGIWEEHEDSLVAAGDRGGHERAVIPGQCEGVGDGSLLASDEHISEATFRHWKAGASALRERQSESDRLVRRYMRRYMDLTLLFLSSLDIQLPVHPGRLRL